MQSLDRALAWLSFILVVLTTIVSPWIFGAWEAWHFWPASTLIFISGLAFSIRLILKAYRAEIFDRAEWKTSGATGKAVQAGFFFYAIFLVYAFVRAIRVI